MFLVSMTIGFAIEVHCTSGNKHGHEKLPSMLCYRLAYTLHSFSPEPGNIEMYYFNSVPRIVKMFVNIKYILLV